MFSTFHGTKDTLRKITQENLVMRLTPPFRTSRANEKKRFIMQFNPVEKISAGHRSPSISLTTSMFSVRNQSNVQSRRATFVGEPKETRDTF